MLVTKCDQTGRWTAARHGREGRTHYGFRASVIGTVPPSVAETMRLAGLNPFSLSITVCVPAGTSTRAGVNLPVEFPSTKISAPAGSVLTCAQAMWMVERSVSLVII